VSEHWGRANQCEAARVLVADDEEDMRLLIRTLLEAADIGVEIVAEAASGDDALARWRDLRPDIVVLDQRMPGLSGMEVAARMLERVPDQAIVLFSAYLTDELRLEILAAGVRACLTKEEVFSLPEVVRGIARVN